MSKFIQTITAILVLATPPLLHAESINLSTDLDTLGSNQEIIERARALNPNSRFSIVQNRVVDRYNRLEVAFNGGLVAGGESYLRTNNWGGTLAWHFSPRWSIGASYDQYTYGLTAEGERVFADAQNRIDQGHTDYNIPQIVYPDRSGLVHLSWYPIYGKTNLFDIRTAQFDFYLQGGIGQMQTTSPYRSSEIGGTSTSPLYSIGAGMGIWMAQHFTTRLELKHQMYEDNVRTGSRQINWTTINASIGFLL